MLAVNASSQPRRRPPMSDPGRGVDNDFARRVELRGCPDPEAPLALEQRPASSKSRWGRADLAIRAIARTGRAGPFPHPAIVCTAACAFSDVLSKAPRSCGE